jgi:TamB, inner membrane protein subunit of TAM complex
LLFTLVVFISILFTLYVVIQNNWVQTLVARLAANYLSKELKTDILIGGFNFSLTKGLIIEDIHVKDRKHQEFFAAHKLSISISKLSLRKKILDIRQVSIDKGVFQLITYKGDSTLNLKFILDYFASNDTNARMDTTTGIPWKLSFSTVKLVDTRFHFQDENIPLRDPGMNFSDIDVNHINLLLTDFIPDKDTLNARIKHLSAIERSGFTIKSMSGEFHVSPAFLKAENLLLVTNNSDLDLSFEFLYKQWSDYNDFLNKVKIVARIRPSYLDLADVGAFAPELYVMKDKFQFSGDIKGTVNNFHARNFRFAFGTRTKFWGNISANGLPDVEETFVDLNIKSFSTNKTDIESIKIPGDLRNLTLPDFIEKMGTAEIRGTFTGFYNDFAANIKMETAIGSATTDLLVKKQKKPNEIYYQGSVNMINLQLGEILENRKFFGGVTLRADVKGKGFSFDAAALTMNVHVDSVKLYKYDYRDIDVKGSLLDKKFSGHVSVKDTNLALVFDGSMDFSDSIPAFDFTSTIRYANLFKLKLLERDSILYFAAKIKVDFTGSKLDNIDGTIKIDSTVYQEGAKLITMDHLVLFTSTDDQKHKSYKLTSDFVDATVYGDFNFSEILPSTVLFIENYLASFQLNDSLINIPPSRDQVLKYKITFKNSDELTNVFLPFLKIAPTTVLEGSYDEKNYRINLDGQSPDLEISGVHLENWYMKAITYKENLSINTGCKEFFYGNPAKKDSTYIIMDSLNLISNMNHDTVHYSLSWTSQENRSVMGGFLSFTNSPALELGISQFDVMIDHRFWKIAKDNSIVFDNAGIEIQNLAFSSKDELLKVDGRVSRNSQDTLYASFKEVDISHLDYLMANKDLDIDGILSGDFKLVNPFKGFTILSDLRLDSFKFNKEVLGNATFKVVYDNAANRFDLKSQISYTGNSGTNIPLTLSGSVFMNEKEPRLNFDINLKNLNLVMVSPYVSSFMSGIHGLASGDIKVRGTSLKPVVTGQLKLMRTEFKINYLNVSYSMADVVTIDSNSFNFNNIAIFDSLGNKAYLNGKITHDHFRNLALDLSIDFNNFSTFRNSYSQNPIFYGNARASGNVTITGPVDNLFINVKARTGTGTHVIIPIDLTSSVGQSDYIIFKDPKKDTIIVTQFPIRTPSKGLSLALALYVRPDANIEVFLPDQLGNIKASGSGNLSMSMTPNSGFSLLGAYNIDKGSFFFALKNLMRLSFTISEGSTITWAGDPADANVAIHAIYKTRVPLEGIVTEPSLAAKRIPVECVIHLGGKLMNPDISFSLNLPNAEEQIKSQVYAAIDTNNQAELSQQVLSILVMNQFKSITGTGNTGINVSSTSLTLVTNQLSTWLSGITQNVNVGVNYKAGTATTGQEFDVAISTQLLNDRLLMDGTFGMTNEKQTSQQQASSIVGDINIEYILTRNRRWRLRAFNRTNTVDNLLNNNAPYTQGFGVSWQRGFDKVGDLFKNEKKRKKL